MMHRHETLGSMVDSERLSKAAPRPAMRIATAVPFFLWLAIPGLAWAQSAGELRGAVQDCVRYAALKATLESSPVDGFYEATLSCAEGPARDLYVALGHAGAPEAMTQFVDGARGLARRFGKSGCYQTTQDAKGEPTQAFSCRLALDTGGILQRSR